MLKRMNKADMEKMLREVVPSDKTLNCEIWAVIMKSTGEMLKESLPGGLVAGLLLGGAIGGAVGGAFGAASNIYC